MEGPRPNQSVQPALHRDPLIADPVSEWRHGLGAIGIRGAGEVTPMSIAKAYDVAHVRFRAPDLDAMQAFLTEFGMLDGGQDEGRLFMRGYGTSPFVHATEKAAEPGFVSFGIWVNSEEDLTKIAAHDDVPVEDFDAPGGGKVARLTDPDGFVVEVLAGQAKLDPVSPLDALYRLGLEKVRGRSWEKTERYRSQNEAMSGIRPTNAKGSSSHESIPRLRQVLLQFIIWRCLGVVVQTCFQERPPYHQRFRQSSQ